MTVKECYREVGGNYDNVLARLGDDGRIMKYLRFFFMEESFAELKRTLGERSYKKAFEHAHNLKGAALNLSLDRLFDVTAVLCDALRSEEPAGDVYAMLEAVAVEYENTKKTVGQIEV